MKAYEVRDVVRANFSIAFGSLNFVEATNKTDKSAMFNIEGVRSMMHMIETEILEDINRLEQREVDEVVKEVMG